MQRIALVTQLAIWIAAALASSLVVDANGQVVVDDPNHQAVIRQLLQDQEVFPVTKSEGLIKGATPDAAELLRIRFRQRGIEVDSSQAEALISQLLLRGKGQVASRIDPAIALTPHASGHKGTHGDLAEVDISRTNPNRYGLSRASAMSADGSIYQDGRVVGHWQSKCTKTTVGSRSGVVEDFTAFLRKDYRSGGRTVYEGFVPRDQYQALLDSGVIDSDGRYRDIDELRNEINQNIDAARSGGRDDKPLIKEALLETGRRPSGLSDDTLRQLRFKPTPKTYEEYRAAVAELPKQAKVGEFAEPRIVSPSNRAMMIMSALLLVYEFGTLQSKPLDTRTALGLAAATGESASALNPSAKAVKRVAMKLPKSLRTSVPSARSLTRLGRVAGAAGIVITAAVVGYDILEYSRGNMTKREFQASMAGSGGALAAAGTGAWAGAKIGAFGGPWGVAIGATVGGIGGGILGAFAGEAAVSSYWQALDETELDYSIELLKQKIRAAGINVN